MNSLDICLVSETFPPEINGVANTLGHLGNGLRARGHRLQLVRPRQPGEPRSPDQRLILVRGWPIPGYPGLQWGQVSQRRLLRHWRRLRPDVIYIATEGPLGLAALRAAGRLGIPVVSGFHTNFQQYGVHYVPALLNRLLDHYLRWFHNRSRLTLVPSPSQRQELERRGFERVELLLRGVDGQLFNPSRRCTELRRQWRLGEDDIAVLYVGRLAAEKNLRLLARAFEHLCQSHPQRQLRLVVVGDGPLRAELERDWPDALFCGAQGGETLARHYASADLFLFPSLSETFGNVVLEAQASGLAVVAYDLAAAALHIRHGYNGALAMPGEEAEFCDAAAWLLEEPERLRRVRLNARQHAGRQHWGGIVEHFETYLSAASAAQWPSVAR